MTNESSTTDNRRTRQHALGWLLFPLALFPLVALLTYDWRAIDALQIPAEPSSNWIGALGDSFAYHGYMSVGLAVWLIPILCIVAGLSRIAGRRLNAGRRKLWFLACLLCAASLVQVLQNRAPGLDALLASMNIPNAGGRVGYLVMTRCLQPLLGDFGATILVGVLFVLALIAAVGLDTLAAFFMGIFRWMSDRETASANVSGNESGSPDERILAAQAAREEARRQREEERRVAREEKLRLKEEKRLAKERLKEQRREERDRRALEQAGVTAQQPPDMPRASFKAPAAHPAPAQPRTAQAEAAAEQKEQTSEDKGPYILPPLNLLAPLKKTAADHSDVGETGQNLINTLKIFGIDATLSYTVQGPVVTKYAIELAPGTRYSAVTNISDNLMGALRAKSLRIEAPIPGEDRIGIEVPNRSPAGISFREIFESDAWRSSNAELPLLFGKRADGKELVADLATMPHMLVAGATGQGKSVCLNAIINGLLMSRTPDQLKLIMVDPKCVEFAWYAKIPHLLVPVITDNRKVVFSLHWAVAEMEKRLKLFARAKVKNIYDYNHRRTFVQTDMFGNDEPIGGEMPKTVPYIVIIIDEAADLIGQCGKDVNPDIQRITQKARAAGIHLILATQRPDAKIITGAIKANNPGRVAFKTSSSVDSRTILDDTGAENLIGRGDMLFRGKDGLLIRAQGAWISDDEISAITQFIETHTNTQFDKTFADKLGRVKETGISDPFADNEDDPDNQPAAKAPSAASQREMVRAAADADLYKRALECVINTNRASTSHFQRQLSIGYNHAAKLCDKLEAAGVIGPQRAAGPREIIMTQEELLAVFRGGEPAGGESQEPSAEAPDSADNASTTASLFDNEESPA